MIEARTFEVSITVRYGRGRTASFLSSANNQSMSAAITSMKCVGDKLYVESKFPLRVNSLRTNSDSILSFFPFIDNVRLFNSYPRRRNKTNKQLQTPITRSGDSSAYRLAIRTPKRHSMFRRNYILHGVRRFCGELCVFTLLTKGALFVSLDKRTTRSADTLRAQCRFGTVVYVLVRLIASLLPLCSQPAPTQQL